MFTPNLTQPHNPLRIKIIDRVYAVKGRDITALRDHLGITQEAVAKRCGWSRTYQTKLENTAVNELRESSLKLLVSALRHDWCPELYGQ